MNFLRSLGVAVMAGWLALASPVAAQDVIVKDLRTAKAQKLVDTVVGNYGGDVEYSNQDGFVYRVIASREGKIGRLEWHRREVDQDPRYSIRCIDLDADGRYDGGSVYSTSLGTRQRYLKGFDKGNPIASYLDNVCETSFDKINL